MQRLSSCCCYNVSKTTQKLYIKKSDLYPGCKEIHEFAPNKNKRYVIEIKTLWKTIQFFINCLSINLYFIAFNKLFSVSYIFSVRFRNEQQFHVYNKLSHKITFNVLSRRPKTNKYRSPTYVDPRLTMVVIYMMVYDIPLSISYVIAM